MTLPAAIKPAEFLGGDSMPRRTKRSRKAAKLSQALHADLAAYALAAGAAGVTWLALAPPADAQIVYTPTHELLTKDGTCPSISTTMAWWT
jgi:hypothetical protein